MSLNIVLLEPEIAGNTGNIGRTCVLTGAVLHLIEPLGFHLSDKAVKKSGMDYWDKVVYYRYKSLDDFYDKNPKAKDKMYLATTKSKQRYTDVNYRNNDYIMFGKESAGIPEKILEDHTEHTITIPMNHSVMSLRSLNLSNSVSIILYEALRQLDFNFMN